MQRGYNFGPRKMLSGIKSDFLEFCLIPGGKYCIAMTHSLLERILCNVISQKAERAVTFAFYVFTSFMHALLVSNFKSIS